MATSCGFESHHRHQKSRTARPSCFFGAGGGTEETTLQAAKADLGEREEKSPEKNRVEKICTMRLDELGRIPKEKVRAIAEQNIADIRSSNRRDFRF